MKKTFFTFTFLFALLVSALAQVPSKAELYKIGNRIFDSWNFEEDITYTVSIIDEKPNKPKKAAQFKAFERHKTNQKTFLQIAPEVDKGMGYLQDHDNAWTYDPNTRQFEHFSLKQNVGDSNMKLSDVGNKETFSDRYEILSASEAMLGKIPVYRIETKPIYKDAEYAKEILFVNQKAEVLLKVEQYGASARLMRTILMAKYVNFGKTKIPIHQIIINNIVPGEKTTVILSDYNTTKIPDVVFTKAYLEKVN
ncbi:MAG: outer membrane lipoprotein-sorting protein [Treponemataceae bacterium]